MPRNRMPYEYTLSDCFTNLEPEEVVVTYTSSTAPGEVYGNRRSYPAMPWESRTVTDVEIQEVGEPPQVDPGIEQMREDIYRSIQLPTGMFEEFITQGIISNKLTKFTGKFKVGDKVKLNPNMKHFYTWDLSNYIGKRIVFIVNEIDADNKIFLGVTEYTNLLFSYEKYLMRVITK